MEKEKRKGQPQKTYLGYFSILLLVLGIICGVWFVNDWVQPFRMPNLLAELIPDDEMEEVYKSDGYPEIESVTAYLQDNLEIGVSTKSDVIELMAIYAPTKNTLSSYKFDDCYASTFFNEALYDYSLFCNVLIFRSFRHQVDIYYAMGFNFDTTLASMEAMAYERRFKSYVINPFLGIATVVFLLAASVVGLLFHVHRVALRQTALPDKLH